MGLLPDMLNCGLHMHRECRERFPRHWLQRKPLISDTGMHHGACVTHMPWCMSGSLTRGGGKNVPGIPGACATRNFTYLARGQWPCLLSPRSCLVICIYHIITLMAIMSIFHIIKIHHLPSTIMFQTNRLTFPLSMRYIKDQSHLITKFAYHNQTICLKKIMLPPTKTRGSGNCLNWFSSTQSFLFISSFCDILSNHLVLHMIRQYEFVHFQIRKMS